MEATHRPLFRLALPWLGAALALTLAIGCGVLLAELLMSPPSSELRELAAYFTVAGAATMAAGWALASIVSAGWCTGLNPALYT